MLPGAPPGDAGDLAADWLRVKTWLTGAGRLLVLGDLVVQVQVGDAHGSFLTGWEGERDGLLTLLGDAGADAGHLGT